MKTRFENTYVLDVMSDDHPGIVAAVSGTVESLGGNIDACSQTVLCGYFTLIMVVSFPETVDADDLAGRINAVDPDSYQVMARRVDLSGYGDQVGQAERFVVTAFGEDRPGIIRQFSEYLASKDVNIVDLYGSLQGGEFVLSSQVEIPANWDITMLQTDLEELGKELGFAVRLQHENIFVATNQLRLTSDLTGRA